MFAGAMARIMRNWVPVGDRCEKDGSAIAWQAPGHRGLPPMFTAGERAARLQDSEDDVLYYLNDHLGSTVAIVDTAGTLRNWHQYRPFGAILAESKSAPNRYDYTGKEKDAELGIDWNYFGARYYDPGLRRFTSVDPLASKYPGWSPYVYCLDNPMKFVDPDGRDVAFAVSRTERTKNFGHTDLFYQDAGGKWFKYNQGDYGVKIAPVEGPSEGALLLDTESWQDALISESANRSHDAHESGELEYDFWFNNCLDAALDVVNESGAGITIEGAATPAGWVDSEKDATVEVVPQQDPEHPSDATTVRVIQPKWEEVKKEELD